MSATGAAIGLVQLPDLRLIGLDPQARRRRSPDDIEDIRCAIEEALATDAPMTVRQMFYRLVAQGVIQKSEVEYKGTVSRVLAQMRRSGRVDYAHIADSTRWQRKPQTWDSLQDMLQSTANHYRRAIWRDLDDYIEVWCEKDALAGVLYQETEKYDVPLMVTRGYASLTFLHSAAVALTEQMSRGKMVTVYYLGDFDPSGVDITRHTEETLREFAKEMGADVDLDFAFEKLAVHEWQIAQYGLMTRPTKRSDTRSRNFAGESVELDAIPPRTLRALVASAIAEHIPEGALDVVQVAEESERAILSEIARAMNREAPR